MTTFPKELQAHLNTGVTTLCRAWLIARKDGVRFGFTDHDLAISFDGITFTPDTGLSAMALEQSTGLSVDNTEAMGVLSDAAIKDSDIDAGRFDGAEVTSWLVNWNDPAQRLLQFRGNIGEIKRAGGAFQAELRGLTDKLNRPIGRVFQRPCSAVLGDRSCGVDMSSAIHRVELSLATIENDRVFRFEGLKGFGAGWFDRGALEILSGDGAGLSGAIKGDRQVGVLREVTLWEPIRAKVQDGDQIRLLAGCDKRFATCGEKFANIINFQGFPDIPEEEWMMITPSTAASRNGGSRR